VRVVPPTAPQGTAGEWLSTLPSAAGGVNGTAAAAEAVIQALAGTLDVGIPYPLPTANSMPTQESTPARPQVP